MELIYRKLQTLFNQQSQKQIVRSFTLERLIDKITNLQIKMNHLIKLRTNYIFKYLYSTLQSVTGDNPVVDNYLVNYSWS